jgi:hypothetical protein
MKNAEQNSFDVYCVAANLRRSWQQKPSWLSWLWALRLMRDHDWPNLSRIGTFESRLNTSIPRRSGTREGPTGARQVRSFSSQLLRTATVRVCLFGAVNYRTQVQTVRSNTMLDLRKRLVRKLKRKELAPEVSSCPNQHSPPNRLWNALLTLQSPRNLLFSSIPRRIRRQALHARNTTGSSFSTRTSRLTMGNTP